MDDYKTGVALMVLGALLCALELHVYRGIKRFLNESRGGGEVVLAKKRQGKKEVSGWRGGSPR